MATVLALPTAVIAAAAIAFPALFSGGSTTSTAASTAPAAAVPPAARAAAPQPSATVVPEPVPCTPSVTLPASDTSGPKIMIVGDSLTQGSSGDYTWRYRLYQHLAADGVHPDFVGPYNDLFDNVSNTWHCDHSYADPDFGQSDYAYWGMMLATAKNTIGAEVTTYHPQYLVVLLGMDDLTWGLTDAAGTRASLVGFIANARAAEPGIRIVLGLLPPDSHQQQTPSFGAVVADFNRRMEQTARAETTTASPIVIAHDGAGLDTTTDLWDQSHPNAEGEIIMAAGFADALASGFHLGLPYPTPYPAVTPGPSVAPQLSVSGGPGTLTLTWLAVPGANGYVVDVADGRGPFRTLPIPLAGSPWTGEFTPGHTYRIRLRADKGTSPGVYSAPVTVTVPR